MVGFASVCCAHLPSKMNNGCLHWQFAAVGTSPTLHARELGVVGFASVCCAHLPSKMNSGSLHWQFAAAGTSPTLHARVPVSGRVTFDFAQFGGDPVQPDAHVCCVVTTPFASVVLVV